MYFTVFYKDFNWLSNPSGVFVTNGCKKVVLMKFTMPAPPDVRLTPRPLKGLTLKLTERQTIKTDRYIPILFKIE
jgi:hypothetical protein